VCLVNFGPDAGKLCVIVDIVDQNKCLVEGPRSVTGVARSIVPFKRLALTDLVCKISRSAKAADVAKALTVHNKFVVLCVCRLCFSCEERVSATRLSRHAYASTPFLGCQKR
jgi:ribosomal protein L14E/L6E/L27E